MLGTDPKNKKQRSAAIQRHALAHITRNQL